MPAQRLLGFLQDVIAVAAQVFVIRHILTDAGGITKGKFIFVRRWARAIWGGPLSHLKETAVKDVEHTNCWNKQTPALLDVKDYIEHQSPQGNFKHV